MVDAKIRKDRPRAGTLYGNGGQQPCQRSRAGLKSTDDWRNAALLAALRNLSPARLASDRMLFGALLETFVFAELLKLSTWNDGRVDFFFAQAR